MGYRRAGGQRGEQGGAREAERESLEIFYAMREELHFYLNRTQLLETVLAASGRVGLILRADGALGPVYAKHSHLHFWR